MSLPLRLVQDDLPAGCGFHGIVGRHPRMLALFDDIRHAALLQTPLVIEGPTGSGKELVARAVHDLSGRKGPLIAFNVSEIAEHLVESELYGAIKGAYTGAVADRRGLVEAASQGTLFLDEAGDLPVSIQAKLLRVLETERVRRLGSTQETVTSFRLLVSVQRPAVDLVTTGRWRSDFYYRVAGVKLTLPALVERASDIPILANHFARILGSNPVSADELDVLQAHTWPGNVRELRRVLERAIHVARGRMVRAEDLCGAIDTIPPGSPSGVMVKGTLRESVQDAERQHIERVMARSAGDWRMAATLLGVSKSTLYRRLEALGLSTASQRRRRSG